LCRIGHHSTSDDSSAYRSKKEVADWMNHDSPINRFRKYLEARQWWNEELESTFKKQTRTDVLKAFAEAEKRKKPGLECLFSDVYDELPWNLVEQKRELEEIMKKYPEHYDASGYSS
jgi:2-oxoisovalerate dehydrogenase E1 component alpha subunit